ncbi:MAG: branched-chain amino acid transport system substrate-binding protein [Pseudonocardiales bacterium]|nr:branched-chain amino acid transport system substrate-binding protein [Pseudonocardiales bacterium]
MQKRTFVTIGVLAVSGALVLSACSSSKSKTGGLGGGSSTSTGGGSGQTYTLGFIGALSGPNAQLGINEKQGAQLAIDQANSSGKYKFKVALDPQDSEGAAATAPAAATALISNAAVIGVIGPAFSGESLAVNKSFCAASPSMPIVTASASKATLQQQGWACWHRIIPNDNVEGAQGADWLARTGAHKVFVLSDKSPYGQGVADAMSKELRAKGVAVTEGGVDGTTTKNYGPIAQTIASSGADAMFYGGYDAQAALLAKALQAAGFKGRTVSGNGAKDSTFTKNAGAAGNGWYFTCGCQDATTAAPAKAFATAYQAKWNQPPSTYSPEAYDAANLFIDVMNTIVSGGGTPSRDTIMAGLKTVDYKGITTDIKFQANGEVESTSLIVNLFKQTNGQITGLGNINDVNS